MASSLQQPDPSSPFQADGRTYWFKERGTMSPSFYTPVDEETARETIVKSDGVPIAPGFTLAEVAPERRWAVQRNGEVYQQRDFVPLYYRMRREFYTAQNEQPPDQSAEPVPSVEEFVATRICRSDHRRLERISVQHEPQPIQALYNQDGTLASENPNAPAPPGFQQKAQAQAAAENTAKLQGEVNELKAMVEKLTSALSEKAAPEKSEPDRAETPTAPRRPGRPRKG